MSLSPCPDARAPAWALLVALSLAGGLACSGERESPASGGGIHPAGFADERSADFHAIQLRARRWAPMLDPEDSEVCGRCHEGSVARPAGVRFAAPGAPSCSSCHEQGVLHCSTCHREGPSTGAHARHLAPLQGAGLDCSSCHELPGASVIEGRHGNGQIDMRFDTGRAGPNALFNPETKTCAVYCHDHGGARAQPAWYDAVPMRCGDCHGSPPAKHYPGPCTSCHQEPNPDGSALAAGPFHMNGKVDLGDGSGGCGACHGEGPTTGAHARHRALALTVSAACADCHPPYDSPQSPGHLDGVTRIAFGERASAFGSAPSWDGSACSQVACHGAGLPAPPKVVPSWSDTSGAASECGACHGIPPLQHTAATDCGRSDCHTGVVKRRGAQLTIPPEGRLLHINGKLDVNR